LRDVAKTIKARLPDTLWVQRIKVGGGVQVEMYTLPAT